MLLRTSRGGSKSCFQSRCRPVLECLESRNLLSFGAPTNFAAGPGPIAVVTGDGNGDGIPDLAVTNAGGVSLLLGNGDGTFQDARTFAAGGSPRDIAVGDVNGDGNRDLAVTDLRSSNASVTVLLNAVDGPLPQPPRPVIRHRSLVAAESNPVLTETGHGVLPTAPLPVAAYSSQPVAGTASNSEDFRRGWCRAGKLGRARESGSIPADGSERCGISIQALSWMRWRSGSRTIPVITRATPVQITGLCRCGRPLPPR